MKPIQSKSQHTLLWLLSVGLSLPLRAFADGADDFNDNHVDTAKWGTDTKLGSGVLTEKNQRLEFTCSNALSDGDTLRPWILERFPVSSNWTVQVDTYNNTAPSAFPGGQVTSGGFTLFHPTNATSQIYVELYAVPFGAPVGKGFDANLETDDFNVGNADTGYVGGNSPVLGAVRMEYTSSNKTVICSYDADTSDGYQWTELASYGLAGTDGTTANTDWGLSDDQQFAVWVYGYSAGMTVPSGQLYLDNFTETGGAASSGGPSPVPVGNFQFKFPTNNPLLVAIANITGNYTGTDPFGSSRQYDIDVAQDESGKVTSMGTVDGITNDQGGGELSMTGGAVTTVNNEPTLGLKTSFTGAGDGVPVTGKLTSSGSLKDTDIGGGTNGVALTASVSAKVAGAPVSLSSTPVAIVKTPSMDANFSKDWSLNLDISKKIVKGKEVTVASAQLVLPNGDTIVYPERTVKYSTTKGYKISFSGGTNTTAIPNRIDKKSKVSIASLLFVQNGSDWEPTGGTISYQFLGQKGTANLTDFLAP